MTSIREVAKKAGVSPSTVSRVMNGTANVDEQKRHRVLRAIEETGFQPNELARALFKKSSRIIGIIVPNIENPFFSEIAKAVEEEAYRNGFKMLLCNSNNDSEKERLNIQMLNQMKADGIIIMSNGDATGDYIADSSVPVVVVDRKMKGGYEIANIESDHYNGGKLAMEHLIACGCRNIVCMKGPQDVSSGKLRYQGYRDVCRKYGVREQAVECGYSYESGLEAIEEILSRYPGVDGIVASNDMTAIASYKVLHGRQIRVPEDIQLIGFDNVRFSSLFTPEFTTVTQSITQMGTLAAQIIVKNSNGEAFERENIFEVSLVERQTTKKRSYEREHF